MDQKDAAALIAILPVLAFFVGVIWLLFPFIVWAKFNKLIRIAREILRQTERAADKIEMTRK